MDAPTDTAVVEEVSAQGLPAPRPWFSALNRRRWDVFKSNRRGYWSLWIFLILFFISLFAELIANDKPLLVYFKGDLYSPIFRFYPETQFGGEFETEADYHDPYVADKIKAEGWMIWPPIRFAASTVNLNLPSPAPSPPSAENWLGTDDQGRDVAARLIYGFRISVLFGLFLTVLSSIVGVIAGALQGYFGGWVDISFQRFIEIWSGMPQLYLLIILSSVIEPSFSMLLVLLTVAGLFVLRRRRPDLRRPYRTWGYPLLPAAFIAVSLFFLFFILKGDPRNSGMGLALTALGIPAYAWFRRRGTAGAPATLESTP